MASEKQKMLAEAKKNYQLHQNSEARKHFVEKHTGLTQYFKEEDLPHKEKTVLYFKRNQDCKFILEKGAYIIKILIENCTNCTFTLNGTVLTSTAEIWESKNITVNANTKVKTLQLDLCHDMTVRYLRASDFETMVQAGIYGLNLSFIDTRETLQTGYDILKQEHTDIDDKTDQFITRFIDGKLLTERIIRLANDFPTTEREQREFIEKSTKNAKAAEEATRKLLDSALGSKVNATDKEKLDELSKHHKQQAEDATGQLSFVGKEERDAARGEYKKKAGNEAFSDGNFKQAAVFYTEAIHLLPDNYLCYSNRSACWLKLGEHEKALADADACIAIKEDFVKGYFRRGLSLHALHRYPDAVKSFDRALALDPNNKQVLDAIKLSEYMAAKQQEEERKASYS